MVMKIFIDHDQQWRPSHNAVTHMRNKNSNIQGRSPNMVKEIFHIIRNFLKGRIRSLRE